VSRIAVMQPYYFPYAGYFRLLQATDHFVILDCVQFPRRGRVHRTELPGPAGAIEWLTLPLARQPRDVLIRDLRFAADARMVLDRRLARYSWLTEASGGVADRLRAHLYQPLGSVIDHLADGIALVADLLGLAPIISRSSILGLDPDLRGQERVIAIVRALGGTDYINAPGGRGLYDRERFTAAGLTLSFLAEYEGPHRQLLPALVSHPLAAIAADVRRWSRFEPSRALSREAASGAPLPR
jgi:WbqC-like protein family